VIREIFASYFFNSTCFGTSLLTKNKKSLVIRGFR